MGTGVLWAYVCSGPWYKLAYIAAAIAVVATAIIAASGRLRTDGLLRATLPVLGYFALLLLTAAWADYPRETLRYVLLDSIGIVVFVLFFLAGRNSSEPTIACAIATIVIPTLAQAAFEYLQNPFAVRFAGYSFSLLPLVFAFGAAGASLSRRRWPYLLAMALTFAFLLTSRSRTPIAAAIFVTAMAVLAFGRSPADRIRKGAAAIAAAIAIVILVAIVPVTRPMILTTVGRITRDLPLPEVHARLEKEMNRTAYWRQVRPPGHVAIRTKLSELSPHLARESFPIGIGYMNFQMHYEKVYGRKQALHSMYSAWLIEGGLAVTLYVAVCAARIAGGLWRRFRRAVAEEERALLMAIAIGLAAMLLMGALHQIHQSPALWLLLGLAGSDQRPPAGRHGRQRWLA